MEASIVPSAIHGVKWSMPTSGPDDYPPSVGPDEYTIINPDFWAKGVDSSKFKGWSNLSEVSVLSGLTIIDLYSDFCLCSGLTTSTWRFSQSGW